jgi:hypothetical protein
MKTCWPFVLLIACAVPGCFTLPTAHPDPKPAPHPKKEAPAGPKRPTNLVNPDQVTDDNARQMSKVLWDELDRDSQTNSGPRQ